MVIRPLSDLANDDFLAGRSASFSLPNPTPASPITVSGTNFLDRVTDNTAPPIATIIQNQQGNNDPEGRPVNPSEVPATELYENESRVEILKNAANAKISGRVKNPLSYLATYTYQLSLYMISPTAYEAFIASGRRTIEIFNKADAGKAKVGAFLVAQGGGIGADQFRAPGFKYDYFIDKLSIETIMPASTAGQNSVVINYKFSITEPYGFSFVSQLARAQREIQGEEKNKFPSGIQPQDTTRNFFILGIRFYGWDSDGNQMLGNEIMPDGQPLDPNASGTGALFESYTELAFTSFKFRVDGRSTMYNIEAQPTAVSGVVNVRRGMVTSNRDIQGTTVRDMLLGENGLLTQLNKEQEELAKTPGNGRAIKYSIVWADNGEIADSLIVTDNITDKTTQATTTAKNSTESTDAAALASTPNKNKRRMSIGKIPIVQAIEQIIGNSTYIQDALTKNYTDAKEMDQKTNTPYSKQGKGKELKWFNISPEISNIEWDTDKRDWVYDIKYIIKPYLIPNIPAPYVNTTTNYYGPHKRYDYWYTGKNTEILAYEQTINNNYFLSMPDPDGTPGKYKDKVGITVATNTEPGEDKSNSGGTLATAAVNAFKTSLYDPASFVEAKFQILGDPDYLMNSTVSSIINDTARETTGKIDGTSRQIFFEVDFKEAVDYNVTDTAISDLVEDTGRGITGQPGTMALNDSIEFWKYDTEDAKNVQGVSYQLLTVKSNFSGGAFTQNITSVINRSIASDALDKETQEQLEVRAEEESNSNEVTQNSSIVTPGNPGT